MLRNLSANGILLSKVSTEKVPGTMIPKILHLDKAKIMSVGEKSEGVYGHVHYRAPEMVRGLPYDFKVDDWSFGVIIFFMLTKSFPFNTEDESTKNDKIEEKII